VTSAASRALQTPRVKECNASVPPAAARRITPAAMP
jgi:hypothetical protein